MKSKHSTSTVNGKQSKHRVLRVVLPQSLNDDEFDVKRRYPRRLRQKPKFRLQEIFTITRIVLFCTSTLAASTGALAQDGGLIDQVWKLMQDFQRLQDENAALQTRIGKLEGRPEWPEGRYCVMRSGQCPANFTRHDGRIAAMWTYAGAPSHIDRMVAGDSAIVPHNPGPQNQSSNGWHGELRLSLCCKIQN